MRLLKQLSAVLTLAAVLVLPLGVMGCAQEAPQSDTPAASDIGEDTDAEMDSDLGEPEGGTNL